MANPPKAGFPNQKAYTDLMPGFFENLPSADLKNPEPNEYDLMPRFSENLEINKKVTATQEKLVDREKKPSSDSKLFKTKKTKHPKSQTKKDGGERTPLLERNFHGICPRPLSR